jgi:HlyD family secretion protein
LQNQGVQNGNSSGSWKAGRALVVAALMICARFGKAALSPMLKWHHLYTLSDCYLSKYCCLSSCALLLLSGCTAEAPPPIVGTLERHRIEVTPSVSEQIVRVAVREGDRVQVGQLLAELDSGSQLASRDALAAELSRARQRLRELQNGARPEEIAAAAARLAAADADQLQTAREYQRLHELSDRGLVAASQLDAQQRLRDGAAAAVSAAQADLQLLRRGTRNEQLEQARADVRTAEALLAQQEIVRARLQLNAPVDGVVESIPYRQGERPPAGAPVIVLLAAGVPYARVYVPEPLRTRVLAGTRLQVHVDGVPQALAGVVRFVAGEASFTPYYALTQRDRSRLSYVAEIDLPEAAAQTLPVGLPLEVQLDSTR